MMNCTSAKTLVSVTRFFIPPIKNNPFPGSKQSSEKSRTFLIFVVIFIGNKPKLVIVLNVNGGKLVPVAF